MVRIIDTYVPVQGGAIFQPESDPVQNFCLSSGQAENQVRLYNNIIFYKILHICAYKQTWNHEQNKKFLLFFISDPTGYFLSWYSEHVYNYVGQMDFRQPFFIDWLRAGCVCYSWDLWGIGSGFPPPLSSQQSATDEIPPTHPMDGGGRYEVGHFGHWWQIVALLIPLRFPTPLTLAASRLGCLGLSLISVYHCPL